MKKEDLEVLEQKSIDSMESALATLRALTDARIEAKLSSARVAGVAKELHELIRVISNYGA